MSSIIIRYRCYKISMKKANCSKEQDAKQLAYVPREGDMAVVLPWRRAYPLC